jgi:hypothetical protein
MMWRLLRLTSSLYSVVRDFVIRIGNSWGVPFGSGALPHYLPFPYVSLRAAPCPKRKQQFFIDRGSCLANDGAAWFGKKLDWQAELQGWSYLESRWPDRLR